MLAFGLCAGCNAQNKDNLLESLQAYNDALRWRRHESASKYLRGRARAHFVNAADRRGDVRVTHYQIRHVKFVGSKRAVVLVRFNWYSELRGRMHHTTMTQHWDSKGDWHITDQRWVRGPTLPLLAAAPAPKRRLGAIPTAKK
ncbi:MAG: hypothetical protein KC503_00520 [Myxococcales bacterium]|nr:hypothetical protein [Myxococcales bacterium]